MVVGWDSRPEDLSWCCCYLNAVRKVQILHQRQPRHLEEAAVVVLHFRCYLNQLARDLQLPYMIGEQLLPRSRQSWMLLAHILRDGLQG